MHTTVFILYAGLVAFVSLMRPGIAVNVESWDKLTHLLLYYIFAVFGYRAIGKRRGYWLMCLAIIAYGGLLEVAQSYTPGRQMSGYDMLANTLGVLLGAAVMRWRRSGAREV